MSLGCNFAGQIELRDRLGVLLLFGIDLAERLADDRVLQAGFGALLVQFDDVGVEIGRFAEHRFQRFDGVWRCWDVGPQLMIAPQAASTASAVFFRPA